ncbi:MAG TPA: hypothetical protein VN285_09505 [Candidatus Deferrimicrobium sp.]|nr:hypothetical protein [Candidatus Deferrimicrobium sp.]
MSKCGKLAGLGVVAAALIVLISSVSLQAQPFPPGPDNDSAQSLGVFRIYIEPPFRALIGSMGLPPCDTTIKEGGCYDGADTFRLTSPILYDRETIIARSNPHIDGSAPDVGGTPVGAGIYATMVSDGDHTALPPFEGPAGVTEVHTAVAKMIMQDLMSMGIQVLAGHGIGLPLCPGEVESKTPPGYTDLPGESFFDVFVQVMLPTPVGLAVLANQTPLLIVNDSVDHLPPTVVYIHQNSTAVPVRFVNPNPPFWNPGDLLGYLVLAGHGYSYGLPKDAQAGLLEFLAIMNEHASTDGEMPLPCCNGDGMRGNVDGTTGPSGEIDVSDLTFLVAYLFQAGTTPPCTPEGNVDGITGPAGEIDVADLTHLVAYLFQGGASPAPCA